MFVSVAFCLLQETTLTVSEYLRDEQNSEYKD